MMGALGAVLHAGPSAAGATAAAAAAVGGLLVSTMLRRPLRGRNFSGMDRKVFRPMMTAFLRLGLLVEAVSFLKYAMSPTGCT